MKKSAVLLLAVVLCFGVLTGCGKSDEQAAQDEIAQHLREEAAADGVDLDKEISDEIAAYENGEYQQKWDEAIENAKTLEEESEAFNAEERAALLSYYDAFISADTAEATDAAFAAYNEIYNSVGDKYSEKFMTQRFIPSLEVVQLPLGIDRNAADEKKLFLENYDESYNRIGFQMYAEGVTPTFTLIRKADFIALVSEIVVVVADGTVNTFDLSAYCKDETYMEVTGFSDDCLIIWRGDFSGGPAVYIYLNVHTGEITDSENDCTENLLGLNNENAVEDIVASENLIEYVSMRIMEQYSMIW